MKGILVAWFLLVAVSAAQSVDISTVPPDLTIPELASAEPTPGGRVKQTLPSYSKTAVYHVLYLPTDWKPDRKYPVIVEFAGNGPYRNKFGDVSTGHVEGSRLGYGISGGEGFLWLCLPYLNGDGSANVTSWWGSKPDYNPQPTIDYCREAVHWVCETYGGDSERVVLAGFSRGAIACNFIGLHDDGIAKLWAAFIPYSHYDGVNAGWPYPGADRAAALERLKRLKGRPQFICGEGENADGTAAYLHETGVKGEFTYRGTGFRNHNDAWVLRPSPAREELRAWLGRVMGSPGEERTIEENLASLAHLGIPIVDFTDGTNVEDGVAFLNQTLRACDPPPPKEWKIRLKLPAAVAKRNVPIKGRDLLLHEVLGRIADGIGAEVVITRSGYLLRLPPVEGQGAQE